jgi:Flp pilus assembly protein TadD
MSSRNRKRTISGTCLLLALAVILVFGRTVRHEFVNYDDDQYFYSNPHVQAGLSWAGTMWAFGTRYASNWHPLTWLSLMLDAEVFGTGPAGPHLTNVLSHAANAVLVYLLLRGMTGAQWRSAFVAAVFALHPLRVESVAWVAERKDVLSGFFGLLTLVMYGRYAVESKAHGPKSRVFYGLALLFFILGLMSKPMLVTLPFVMLLLDWWPLRRFDCSTPASRPAPLLHLVAEKLPFFALSAVSIAATVFAQQGAIKPIQWFPLPLRIANALDSYVIYLGQMLYPSGLAVFYPYSSAEKLPWSAVLALGLLAGITAAVLALRRTRPYLLTGWFWYLGMLVPVIGLVQVGDQARADRFTYLPQIGLCILAAWTLNDVSLSWRHRPRILTAGAVVVVAALAVGSFIQTSYWRDSEALWNRALACTTRNYVAHNNLGIVVAQKGHPVEAMKHFQRALEIRPNYADAHNDLGIVLFQQGRSAEAARHFQRALEIKPDFVEAEFNLCNLLAQEGRWADAIRGYRRAVQLHPDSAKLRFRLGFALKHQGEFAEAIAEYRKVLELDPGHVLARNNLAWVLATCPEVPLRNGDEATELAQRARQGSGGNDPQILDTLGAAYAEAGRFAEALDTARQAQRLAEARSNASLAQEIAGRIRLYQANSPYHEKP